MQRDLISALVTRRAVRDFKSDVLTKAEIGTLVEVAISSPSAMNKQPWHISVLDKSEVILEMERQVVDYFAKNGPEDISSRLKSRKNQIFYNAPVVFFVSTPNRDSLMDVGIVAQSIAIGAKGLELSSVILGLPQVAFLGEAGNVWREKLDFPKSYDFGICVAVGHSNIEEGRKELDHNKVSYIE